MLRLAGRDELQPFHFRLLVFNWRGFIFFQGIKILTICQLLIPPSLLLVYCHEKYIMAVIAGKKPKKVFAAMIAAVVRELLLPCVSNRFSNR